jgi:hypothetical protein
MLARALDELVLFEFFVDLRAVDLVCWKSQFFGRHWHDYFLVSADCCGVGAPSPAA